MYYLQEKQTKESFFKMLDQLELPICMSVSVCVRVTSEFFPLQACVCVHSGCVGSAGTFLSITLPV